MQILPPIPRVGGRPSSTVRVHSWAPRLERREMSKHPRDTSRLRALKAPLAAAGSSKLRPACEAAYHALRPARVSRWAPRRRVETLVATMAPPTALRRVRRATARPCSLAEKALEGPSLGALSCARPHTSIARAPSTRPAITGATITGPLITRAAIAGACMAKAAVSAVTMTTKPKTMKPESGTLTTARSLSEQFRHPPSTLKIRRRTYRRL